MLRPKDKEQLIAIFNGVPIPMTVWAFGSRVHGGAHAGSDLDLVIRTASLEKIPRVIFTTLKEKIQESNIPIVVELFDWSVLPESFHKNILEKHEVLYCNTLMRG
ncbi:MAG: nucleotidyltransferase domain-containing protein [Phycisphaerales bacterium]|nr:nucleotidyltransferase domain-containing protein [Phycisphaerales bacterium]